MWGSNPQSQRWKMLAFHSGMAYKREAFIYRGFSYTIATKSFPPDALYYKWHDKVYKLEQGWIDAGGTHDQHNSAPEQADDPPPPSSLR
jgi:hypothetical protein